MVIATVVREHSDIDNQVVASEDDARAWLVKALYLVEDGTLAPDAPVPTMAELRRYAGDLGWDIDVRVQS